MKLNTPIPQPLAKECTKAARIFQSFVDGSNNGLDRVIPRSVLENARGFAIFTIFKAGFLFSARAGSGIVIARLPDGTWSAPSAIGTAGLGVGGQAGAEMTDFLIVLNTRSAIQTFMSSGSLTLGGNLSIAIGPLGRNGEALGSVNTNGKVAAMYSYSKTRGLFGGISVEGSVIVERQDANAIAYNSPVTARMLLGGAVDPPEWASFLTETLQSCTGLPGGRKWIQDSTNAANGAYAFGGMASPGSEQSPSVLKKKKDNRQSVPAFPPATWGSPKSSGSYFEPPENRQTSREVNRQWDSYNFPAQTQFKSDFDPTAKTKQHSRMVQSVSYTSTNPLDSQIPPSSSHSRSFSLANQKYPDTSSSYSSPFSADEAGNPKLDYFGDETRSSRSHPRLVPKQELTKPLQPHEGIARAIALYDFQAVESGDLSFSKGDVITIVQKSDSTDDWWTGKIGDNRGIFPANFVEVV